MMQSIKHFAVELIKCSTNSCCEYCDILVSPYLGYPRNNCILFIFVTADPIRVAHRKHYKKVKR